MMASRIGILIVAFLSYALVASGFFVPFPGPGQPFVSRPTNDRSFEELDQERNHNLDTPTNDQISDGSEQMGNDSFVRSKPISDKNSPERDDPGFEPTQPDSGPKPMPKPVKEPKTKPVLEGTKAGLRNDFYAQSCPNAESIVNATLHKHLLKDPTYAAGLVRLFFHDCFVTGCDASILLDTTPSQEAVEKKASHNGPTVRGYEVIDDIKLQLEAACPGVVSCADILAFATRDSLVYSGVHRYSVAAGRRDGLASLAANVEGNLPTPDFTAEQSIELFRRKGMTLEELVLLVGAHSIGSAHCSVVSGRFHDEEKAKEIDRGYWLKMQTLTICQSEDQDVPFDPSSQHRMDSKFYRELLTKKALIESDQNLATEPRTNGIMKKMMEDQEGWLVKFADAMRRLGEVDVLVGDEGEVRKQCRTVNK